MLKLYFDSSGRGTFSCSSKGVSRKGIERYLLSPMRNAVRLQFFIDATCFDDRVIMAGPQCIYMRNNISGITCHLKTRRQIVKNMAHML